MNFYTIPATDSFADVMAKHCEDIAQRHGCALSQIKIYLPTRRGIRTLQNAFLNLSGGKPRLLPLMQSIGDADLEEMNFSANIMPDIPPAIDPMRRQMVLALLLERAWPHDYNYQQALNIAADLGHLIDQIHTKNLDINNLSHVLEIQEFSKYWEMTTDFLLKVLKDIWPNYLAEHNQIDAGLHRKMRIESLTRHYRDNPPAYPVIMAGSTGSIPATRDFIKTIGRADNGYVVLPALDMMMDAKSWHEVSDGHPQSLLKQLIKYCDVKRESVAILSSGISNDNRLFLMSEMMRPAIETDEWKRLDMPDFQSQIKGGLDGLYLCEGDNDHHESMIIALAMLEMAADPEQKKTATLITPNRYLAMRVQANLRQWGIDIDDSGGTSLTNAPVGQFAMAVSQSVLNYQIQPIALLSVLKSPYAAGEPSFRNRVRSFEKNHLRGVRPHGDFNHLLQKTDKNTDFIATLDKKYAQLLALQSGRHAVQTIITAHINVMEELAKTDDLSGAERLWHGDDGEALAQFFVTLQAQSDIIPDLSLNDYNEILKNLLSKQTFAARYGKHPRLSILGQIESRMVKADRVILAGLNEGVWPPDSGFDAWMSRKMRTSFGLPSLEQKTTLAAHDFATAFCAHEVFITRSKKSDGQPTLPSRWIQRLQTVLSAARIASDEWPHSKGETYAKWANATRHTQDVQSITRPMPRPELAKRPREFSITEIEKWMRDPYSIYAKKILKLKKMDPVDMDLSAADRGTLIHDAMEKFTVKYPNAFLPDDAENQLIEIGEKVFAQHEQNPDIHGFWWPRFTKSAKWFIGHERGWRTETKHIHSEIKGQLPITVDDTQYILNGKADRVETRLDNSISIIDYKTGSAPAVGDVNAGIASQLPLEAYMVSQGAFGGVTYNMQDFELLYWSLGGAGEGGVAACAQGANGGDAKTLIEEAHIGIHNLFAAFHDTNMPYIATPDMTIKIKDDYNDFAHLERIAEWSVGGDDGGDAS